MSTSSPEAEWLTSSAEAEWLTSSAEVEWLTSSAEAEWLTSSAEAEWLTSSAEAEWLTSSAEAGVEWLPVAEIDVGWLFELLLLLSHESLCFFCDFNSPQNSSDRGVVYSVIQGAVTPIDSHNL